MPVPDDATVLTVSALAGRVKDGMALTGLSWALAFGRI